MILRRYFALILVASRCLLVAADARGQNEGNMLRRALESDNTVLRNVEEETKKTTTSTKKKTTKPVTKKEDGTTAKTSTKKTSAATTKKTHHHHTNTTAKAEAEETEAKVDDEKDGNVEGGDDKEKVSPADSVDQDDAKSNEAETGDQAAKTDASKSFEEDDSKKETQKENNADKEDTGENAASKSDDDDKAKQEESNKPSGEQAEESKQEKADSKENKSKADDKESETDPCSDAQTCDECQKLDPSLIPAEKACVWKEDKCQSVAKEDAPDLGNMCDNSTKTKQEKAVDDDEEREGGFMPGFLTLVVFAIAAFAVRTYAERAGIAIPGVGTINPSPRNGGSLHRGSSRGRSSETYVASSLAGVVLSLIQCPYIYLTNISCLFSVPLADDDEWGWEDSGDVELSSRAQQQEDEDMRMAMALSLSESPTIPRPKRTSSATRRTNSGSRSSVGAAASSAVATSDGKF